MLTQVGSPAVRLRLARCMTWVKRWSEAMDFLQTISDLHANYELYKEFLLRFKSDTKYSDFHANQSNLLMGVVKVGD